jgi:hypothetical protein
MQDQTQGRLGKMSLVTRRCAGAALGSLLCLCLMAPAAGATTYTPTEVLVPSAAWVPTGMTVDQSTQALYVGANFFEGKVHAFVGDSETSFGEGNYESLAVNPTNNRIYALTRPQTPIRIEIYNPEGEIAAPPISDPAGKGTIAADSSGNVFSPDIGPISEQQKFTVAATGGTYQLIFEGEKTAPLAWNSGGYEVEQALTALPSIGEGNLYIQQSGQTYTIVFQNVLAYTNLPLIGADSSGLTEGSVTHIETAVDGTNAPPSVKEFSPGGKLLQTLNCSTCPSGAFTSPSAGVAIDDADNLYVADPSKSRVVIFHATPGSPTNYSSVAPTEIQPGAVRSLAVDPVTHQIFVGGDDGEGFHVKGYEVDGTKFADFGLGFFAGNFTFFGTEQLAVNAATGMVYVNEFSFSESGYEPRIYGYSPAPPPAIESEDATVEASRHALMNGLVNPNGTLVLSCKFEYGTTEAYGSTLPCNDPGFGEEPVLVSAEAAPLEPNTVYHYRIIATNEGGTTVGTDQTFKTLIDKALPTTGTAVPLQTSATLEGSVNPLGNPMSDCYFEYGADSSYGAKAPCAPTPGAVDGDVAVSGSAGGLQPNTGYHYRLVAVNAGGTQVGADQVFATLPKAPAITTGAATLVGADRARISGTLNPEGSVSRYQFEYGTTTGYVSATRSATAVGTDTIRVAENITDLQPSTTYHFRLSATSAGGTTHGPDMTLTTAPRPLGRVFLPAKSPRKGLDAAIELQCRGVAIAECKGTLVLRARIKRGIRFILVKVGETAFDFFGGQKKVVTVHLNKAGKKVIAQSNGKPIPAVASAANKNRVVRLIDGGR